MGDVRRSCHSFFSSTSPPPSPRIKQLFSSLCFLLHVFLPLSLRPHYCSLKDAWCPRPPSPRSGRRKEARFFSPSLPPPSSPPRRTHAYVYYSQEEEEEEEEAGPKLSGFCFCCFPPPPLLPPSSLRCCVLIFGSKKMSKSRSCVLQSFAVFVQLTGTCIVPYTLNHDRVTPIL